MAVKSSLYLSESTAAKLDELRKLWGGIRPLERSPAISEAIERAYKIEIEDKRPTKGK